MNLWLIMIGAAGNRRSRINYSPSLSIHFDVMHSFSRVDQNPFDLRWRQARICFQLASADRRNNGSRERSSIDVLVMFVDDVALAKLVRYQLPQRRAGKGG